MYGVRCLGRGSNRTLETDPLHIALLVDRFSELINFCGFEFYKLVADATGKECPSRRKV
jgi:hypothetical protein